MGLVSQLRTIPNSGYLAQVFHYLTGPLGRGCPEDVALRMAQLPDPEGLGLGLRPSPVQLHRLRLTLERIQAHEAAREAPPAPGEADDPLERLLAALRRVRMTAND